MVISTSPLSDLWPDSAIHVFADGKGGRYFAMATKMMLLSYLDNKLLTNASESFNFVLILQIKISFLWIEIVRDTTIIFLIIYCYKRTHITIKRKHHLLSCGLRNMKYRRSLYHLLLYT